MKIFIHESKGGFSDRWIEYCLEKGIAFEIVNCFNTDIISKLNAGDILLWHWLLDDIRAITFARHIIAALQEKGVKVFPDLRTCWHYDDKVAQKYLLEAIGAPLAPAYVFYDKQKAKEWISRAFFPKVFKLRRGAGSYNVQLVKNEQEAFKLVDLAFGKGFNPIPSYFDDTKTKVQKIKDYKVFLGKLKRLPSILMKNSINRDQFPRERGYVYFQDFLPNNAFDTRITVIGGRAFGFIRYVRQNDFRASGSGAIDYDPQKIDKQCVKIAIDVAKKLGTQSLAFDFIYNLNQEPVIVEISYCYLSKAVSACFGYWDTSLKWVPGKFEPEVLVLEDLLGDNR